MKSLKPQPVFYVFKPDGVIDYCVLEVEKRSGKEAGIHRILFDVIDIPIVTAHRWFIAQSKRTIGGKTYIYHPKAYCNIKGHKFQMHRLILNPLKDMLVDHFNQNQFDNRRGNLRICTDHQNLGNMGLAKHNTSGYRGVYWSKYHNNWKARIQGGDQYIYVGSYDTAEEAAKAWNEAAIKYFGSFARLNNV